MFLPGERVQQGETEAVVVRTSEHTVTVESASGQQVTGPEHIFPRVRVPRLPSHRKFNDLPFGDRVRLEECLHSMKLDWNGHHFRATHGAAPTLKVLLQHILWSLLPDLTVEVLDSIVEANAKGEALEHFIPIFESRQPMCPFCADGALLFETDGLVVRPAHPCPQADGLVTEFTLNVPSGKVLITDDLRELCRIADERDINTRWGTHLAILDYAACGLVVGFGIGNTCPTVARHKGGKYTIGHRQGGRRVTGICTDLWAYSIMDYAEAEKRAAYYGLDFAKLVSSVTVAKIPAGLYQFRHFHDVDRDANKVLFATFECIGPAVESEDWTAKDAAFQVHFTQAVQLSAARWPTLYAEDPAWDRQCASVAQSIFRGCIPDRDWHRNGFRNDYRMNEVAQVPIKDIPHFRFQMSWDLEHSSIETTVSGNDAMFGGDIPLNESFAIAAGRVLESAISFGLPYVTYRTVEHQRQTLMEAVDLWYGLVKRYPHVAQESPVFAAWMEDRAAVERWVGALDLSAPTTALPATPEGGQGGE